MIRLFGEVCDLWDGRLHAISHLILLDLGLDLRIAELLIAHVVEVRKLVEHQTAIGFVGPLGIVEV